MIGHEQATRLEASVNAARAAGDIPALIALAASALDQLEPLAATTTGDARIFRHQLKMAQAIFAG